MRQLLALALAAAVAALGAVIIGEYDLSGATGAVAGALLGAAAAEVAAAPARRRAAGDAGRHATTAGVAILAGAGFLWAVWISTNHFRNPIPAGAWAGLVFAVAAAAVWFSTARQRGGHTPPVA